MAPKGQKSSDRKVRKPRRVYPCITHDNIPAATRCEVCGKPICKKCAKAYEGATICGDACWNTLVGSDYKKALAEEKAVRKKKERKADRAVTIGMWAAALAVVGIIGAIIVIKITDKTGEKLWEISGSGYSRNYATDPYSTTVLFASSTGAIKALNARTGTSTWTVNLPKGERPSNPQLIDDNTCLIQSGNNLFLCDSSRSVPAWKFTAPQQTIYGKPTIKNDALFVACSTGYSYYESFSAYGAEMAPLAEAIFSQELPAPWDLSGQENDEEENELESGTITSTITSVDMVSGDVKWDVTLENVRIVGLLVDEGRVYAIGYRPMTYEEYAASLEESYSNNNMEEEEEEGEEDLGTTQLWALDAATGEPEWKLEGTGSFCTSPIISDKGIVFSTRQNIYLVSPQGEIKWTYPLIKRYILSIKEDDDTLLFSTMDGALLCLDLASGKKKWMATTGAPAREIIVTDSLICVPGGVEVKKAPRKVIPTKRWRGSEDLLEAALKKNQGTVFEPNLIGLDSDTGETLWTIDKVEGSFEYVDGVLYVLSHHIQYLFMDASVDSSDLSKEISYLNAYDAATGEKLWRLGIDGAVSDLRLSFGTALVVARPMVTSTAANEGRSSPVRLIAIALR